MAFITDKEELKHGLILFRRADVKHRNWYCRIQLPRADRYKTISVKTSNREAARDQAYDHDADIRFRLKHNVPVSSRTSMSGVSYIASLFAAALKISP